MRIPSPILIALIAVVLSLPVRARQTDQFHTFFPSWHAYLHEIINTNCTAERDAYLDPSDNPKAFVPAYWLAQCILNQMDEFRKAEMGVVTVILGLLPTILQQIGPSLSEISLLATRRPLLAFLLAIAMPSVTMDGPMANPAVALRQEVEFYVRSSLLERTEWPWMVISTLEYVLAAAGAATVLSSIYQLGYWSISISSIAVYSGPVPQSYPPFLWLMLLIPVHVFGFWLLKLQYKPSEEDVNQEKPIVWKSPQMWLRGVRDEFTPCAKGKPVLLRKVDKSALSIVVYYFAYLAVTLSFVFGTVALSSQIFVSLGDVVSVIAQFMVSTIVCRAILSFEVHGMTEVTSQWLNGRP